MQLRLPAGLPPALLQERFQRFVGIRGLHLIAPLQMPDFFPERAARELLGTLERQGQMASGAERQANDQIRELLGSYDPEQQVLVLVADGQGLQLSVLELSAVQPQEPKVTADIQRLESLLRLDADHVPEAEK